MDDASLIATLPAIHQELLARQTPEDRAALLPILLAASNAPPQAPAAPQSAAQQPPLQPSDVGQKRPRATDGGNGGDADGGASSSGDNVNMSEAPAAPPNYASPGEDKRLLSNLWELVGRKATTVRCRQLLLETLPRIRPTGRLGKLSMSLQLLVPSASLRGYIATRDQAKLEQALIDHDIGRPQPTYSDASLQELEEELNIVDDDDDNGSEFSTASSDLHYEAHPPAVGDEIFEQFSPTKPTAADPEAVRLCYHLITHPTDGFKRAIFFDLVPVLRRIYTNVHEGKKRMRNLVLNPADTQLMLGGGRCQSQKTPLKVAQILMCRLLGVSTIVLTTGVSGREDLFKKFTTFLAPRLGPDSLYGDAGHRGPIEQLDAPPPPSQMPHPRQRFRYERVQKLQKDGQPVWQLELVPFTRDPANGAPPSSCCDEPIVINIRDVAPKHEDWLSRKWQDGVCLVVNNTCQAIDKARRLLLSARGAAMTFDESAKFVLTIDEADDFIRTDNFMGPSATNAPIRLEHALKDLCRMGPLIKFDVTATLLAIFLMLQRKAQAGQG